MVTGITEPLEFTFLFVAPLMYAVHCVYAGLAYMLMHILNPKGDPTVYPRVMTDLKAAARPDGSIDVPTLCSSPLLQSIWTETLRLYTDVLVTRNLMQDVTLPLDEEGKKR